MEHGPTVAAWWAMSKADAIARIQADLSEQVRESAIVALHGNENLIRLLAIWHHVPVRRLRQKAKPPAEKAPLHARREWLWSQHEIDHEYVRGALGVNFPAESVVRQAILQGLVNPDGTIFYRAEQYLNASAADIIQGFASVREARKSKGSKSSDSGS